MEKEQEREDLRKIRLYHPDLISEIQQIPAKISFKIGEVAELLSIKPHVLRYWEMEFDTFRPKKMSNGQRLYFRKDVETALFIKHLLYRECFSVRGAKKALLDLKRENLYQRKKSYSEDKLFKKLDQMRSVISKMQDLIK